MVKLLEKEKIRRQLEAYREGLLRNDIVLPDEIEVDDSDYLGVLSIVKKIRHPPESASDVALKVLRQLHHVKGVRAEDYLRYERNFKVECQIHEGLEGIMDSILFGNDEFRGFLEQGLVGNVIVPVVKSNWGDEEPPYFIMAPWMKCDFNDVIDEISTNQTYSLTRKLEFVMKILASYIVLHNIAGDGNGIIHADIKPGNLLLDEKDMVYVTDFNVASWADRGLRHESSHTESQGTMPYMAVELLTEPTKGSPETLYNVKTEIYALGVMIYETLTGTNPFGIEDDDTTHSMISKVAFCAYSPITRLHGADRETVSKLNTICRQAVRKIPDQRQQSVRELFSQVKEVYDSVMARHTAPCR